MNNEKNKRISEIENEIASLPKGYVSKKNIRGRETFYRQWKEDGKVKSEYINPREVDYVAELIDRRRGLQEKLKLEVLRQDDSEKGFLRLTEYARKLYIKNQVGIGYQDYEEIITSNLFYVDKTNFIKEWWENGDAVTLITRPSGFGKTLNLSMVNCFLSRKYQGRSDLFENFNVWNSPKMRALQGSKPVIYLSFADIKQGTERDQIEQVKRLVSEAFMEHDYILEHLNDIYRENYYSYYDNLTDAMAISGISVLSHYISLALKEKVIILLDAYDTPALSSLAAENNEKKSNFFSLFFLNTFKANMSLHRALIMGVSRLDLEYLDVDNLINYGMTGQRYQDSFGFTEKEVFNMIDIMKLTNKNELRGWYGGYTIGDRNDIYNPWSIINYLKSQKLQPFRINNYMDKIIDDVLIGRNKYLQLQLKGLLAEKTISSKMQEIIGVDRLNIHSFSLWSFLHSSGYVRIVNHEESDFDSEYYLAITNKEMASILRNKVGDWIQADEGDNLETATRVRYENNRKKS